MFFMVNKRVSFIGGYKGRGGVGRGSVELGRPVALQGRSESGHLLVLVVGERHEGVVQRKAQVFTAGVRPTLGINHARLTAAKASMRPKP